jgi:hypothetical protein
MDEGSLIESLVEKVEPTPAMELGTAFHQVFADPDGHLIQERHSGPVYRTESHDFDAERVDAALDDIWQLEPLYELKTEDLVFQTSRGPARLVCQADAISGLWCGELKTTKKIERNARWIERYTNSLQWRAYALAFGAHQVSYRIVKLEQLESGIWTVADYESIDCPRYVGLERDVLEAVEGLTDFIYFHDLEPFKLEPINLM